MIDALERVNERLIRARVQHRHQVKLTAMLSEAERTLDEELAQIKQHEWAQASEDEIQTQQRRGLAALFYSILGRAEDHPPRDRQEYLAAKLKHEEHTAAADAARGEIRRLQQELALYVNTSGEYEAALEDKQRLLLKTPAANLAPLWKLKEQMAELEGLRKELTEAIRAGERAQQSLGKVDAALRSAKNWGRWDMFGGGIFVTIEKHNRINEAKTQAQLAQRDLQLFREELADADRRLHVELHLDGFTRFADVFFDGLIMDYVVQTKLIRAHEACGSATAKVTAALEECNRQLRETTLELQRVTEQWQRLLERA